MVGMSYYAVFGPLVKSAYHKTIFLISQPKHKLWVLTYVKIDG